MADPTNLDDFNRLQQENSTISGFGVGNVHISSPCPFCCAPGFRTYELMEAQKVGAEERVCKECGRGSKFVFKAIPGGTEIELVQTCGDDPPAFLPKPRREAPSVIVPAFPPNLHG